MSWLLLKRFVGQFPKWALVAAVLFASTALFGFWWFTHSSKKAVASRPPAVEEDIGPKLALIESKPERLLLVDDDLYDLDTGQLLFKKWLKNGAPLRLFFDASTKKFIAQYERGFVRYVLDGREEAQLAQKEKPAFSDDLKWIVFARAKEVWRADVDWNAFKFTRERKVTSIEQFYETYFTENIFLGTEKTLIVRNMNTLLRVNLDTGNVKPTRIPLGDIGSRRSPDSKWDVGNERGQFYCYDVDADEAKTIPVGRGATNDYCWLNNDRCLAIAAGKSVVSFDRPANALTEAASLPFPCSKLGDPSPDGRFIFAVGGGKGVLVDLENKTAATISGGAGVAWVSKDTFAYSREVPDSELRGTWLRTAGQAERRISPEPYLVSKGGPQLLPLPSAGLVVYETAHGLVKMNPDGTALTELLPLSQPAARVQGILKWALQ